MKYICQQHIQTLQLNPFMLLDQQQRALEDGLTAVNEQEYRQARRLLGAAFELSLVKLAGAPMIEWQDICQLTRITSSFLPVLRHLEEVDEAELCILIAHRGVLAAIQSPAEGSARLPDLVDLFEKTLQQTLEFLQDLGKHAQACHLELTTTALKQRAISAAAH